MEGLRGWAVAVCAAAVVCVLLRRLFPETSLGQQGQMVLSCLFLLTVFSSLPRVNVSVGTVQTPPAAQAQNVRARIEQQTVSTVNRTLLSMVNQALASYGVQAKKVVADINFTEDGGINLGQIIVYIDEEATDMTSVVRQVSERRLGMSVTIAKWEENGR